MEQNQQLTTTDLAPKAINENSMSVFGSLANFESAQRMAKMLSRSTIVPEQFQIAKRGEVALANAVIALEMANRIGASPLMVMQNLYIVHGNVAWSSKFLIASLNTCGRFTPLQYEQKGEGNQVQAVRAWAIDKSTGAALYGTWITWDMVRAEGWDSKTGSKWKTMPEQMFRYRAAAFFQRTFAPEISMGMHTVEEVEDMGYNYTDVSDGRTAQPQAFDLTNIKTVADVNAALLRGVISKEEADHLKEQIIKSEAATAVVEAVSEATPEQNEQTAPSADGCLFPETPEPKKRNTRNYEH